MCFDEPFELGHGKSKEIVEELGEASVFINFFTRLSDYVKISDSVSFDVALNQLGYGLIEIDGIIYSRTGNITKIM